MKFQLFKATVLILGFFLHLLCLPSAWSLDIPLVTRTKIEPKRPATGIAGVIPQIHTIHTIAILPDTCEHDWDGFSDRESSVGPYVVKTGNCPLSLPPGARVQSVAALYGGSGSPRAERYFYCVVSVIETSWDLPTSDTARPTVRHEDMRPGLAAGEEPGCAVRLERDEAVYQQTTCNFVKRENNAFRIGYAFSKGVLLGGWVPAVTWEMERMETETIDKTLVVLVKYTLLD